jgi:hypothetical protein
MNQYNGKSKQKFDHFFEGTTYNFKHFYFPPAGHSIDTIQTYGKQSERYYQQTTEIKKEK